MLFIAANKPTMMQATFTTRVISGRGMGTVEPGSTIEGSSITASSGLAFRVFIFAWSLSTTNKDLNLGLKTRLQLIMIYRSREFSRRLPYS